MLTNGQKRANRIGHKIYLKMQMVVVEYHANSNVCLTSWCGTYLLHTASMKVKF